MFNEPLENTYFNWLCTKVAKVEVPTPSLTYFNLLRELQNTEFSWVVPRDDNRAEDGVELRLDFQREAFLSVDEGWMQLPCSIFEMMYALAKRASFETGKSAIYWFWTMIENLGLKEFNDASNFDPDEVAYILHRFVWRLYEPDGRGGLFPLKNSIHDQREQEIWYQFSEYLFEQE